MTSFNQKEFGAYLRKIRKEKGLTLRNIEDQSGVSNAYLSQLENGKRGIPSPTILKKINGPLGIPYDELMEKAGHISPEMKSELHEETINTIRNSDDLNKVLSKAAELFLKEITDSQGNLQTEYKDMFIKDSEKLYGIEKDSAEKVFNDKDTLPKLFDLLTLEEKISFLDLLIKEYNGTNEDYKEVLGINRVTTKTENTKTPAMLRVPVLGYIAAGQPIFAQDQIDEWMDVPNLWNLKEEETIVLKVKGDSMIGSRIYEGDRVIVKLQPHVENGEIAVVNVNGDEATLKKVKRTDSGQVILYPDNPNYEPIFVENENARVIGKVVQVMFEPK